MIITPDLLDEIRAWAGQGVDLNGIQKNLAEQGVSIRFMDLRFLLLDHDIEILTPAAPAAEAEKPAPEPESPAGAKMTVTLDELQIPGTMLSGKALFPSGIRGAWCFDQTGRFAWTDLSAKPSSEEMKSFEVELNTLLSSGTGA